MIRGWRYQPWMGVRSCCMSSHKERFRLNIYFARAECQKTDMLREPVFASTCIHRYVAATEIWETWEGSCRDVSKGNTNPPQNKRS